MMYALMYRHQSHTPTGWTLPSLLAVGGIALGFSLTYWVMVPRVLHMKSERQWRAADLARIVGGILLLGLYQLLANAVFIALLGVERNR